MEEPTETSPTALQVDGGRVAPAAGEMVRELFAAIRAKNKERVRELLEMEADVNAYEPGPNLIFYMWCPQLLFLFIGVRARRAARSFPSRAAESARARLFRSLVDAGMIAAPSAARMAHLPAHPQ